MLNQIDLARVDLNLLVLFEAVLEEQHVGRAAQRLHLSASAVSHGIRRLRHTLSDPLFLKHPKGMVPTARATDIAPAVAQILAQIREVVGSAEPFDPTRSKRRLIIGAPDALAVLLLPPVLAAIARTAPNVSVGVQNMLPNELIPALDARRIDVALYPSDELPARFESRLLFEEDFIVAARTGHSLGKRLSLKQYCALRHVLVSTSGEPRGFVDDVIESQGCYRTIALTVPSFLFALAVVANSELVGTLPRTVVREYASRFGVSAIEPPLQLGRSQVHAVASKAARMDGAVTWLLELLERGQYERRAPAKKAARERGASERKET